jgi:hypothetical protein
MIVPSRVIWAVSLLGIVGTAFLLFTFRSAPKPQQARLAHPDHASPVVKERPREADSSANGVAPAEPKTDVRVELLTEISREMTEDAKILLNGTLTTMAILELEKQQLSNRNAIVSLNGVQRKIFTDDYAYAAYVSASGDCNRGRAVYTNIVEPRFRSLSAERIRREFLE